ncbi:hypothetical protein Tco_0628414 [Tanacetum coccineum]|uniref:Uncharacterized protein n=1 Tax=Tanacetum coccineum TaxID=301880 RepID=A0ABQ4WQ93_9ASTR
MGRTSGGGLVRAGRGGARGGSTAPGPAQPIFGGVEAQGVQGAGSGHGGGMGGRERGGVVSAWGWLASANPGGVVACAKAGVPARGAHALVKEYDREEETSAAGTSRVGLAKTSERNTTAPPLASGPGGRRPAPVAPGHPGHAKKATTKRTAAHCQGPPEDAPTSMFNPYAQKCRPFQLRYHRDLRHVFFTQRLGKIIAISDDEEKLWVILGLAIFPMVGSQL